MNKQLPLFLLLIAVLIISSCSTTGSSSETVPHSVAKYIRENGTDFSHYEISDLGTDNDYNFHEISYDVYEELETLWLDYINVSPAIAFDSRIIDFGVVYNPEDSVIYKAIDQGIPPFREGQIYILNLKWMGFYGVPIAFKVNKIDSDNKMIEFIYMKNNICNGYQQIYLNTDIDSQGNPFTHIYHISFFKCENGFIDKIMYPPFHQQTIDDFHEKIFGLNGLNWEKS